MWRFAVDKTLRRNADFKHTSTRRLAARRASIPCWTGALFALVMGFGGVHAAADDAPQPAADEELKPPASIEVTDSPWDDGTVLDVKVELSPSDVIPPKAPADADDSPDAEAPADPADEPEEDIPVSPVASYRILRSTEQVGHFVEVGNYTLEDEDRENGSFTYQAEKNVRNQDYWIRVVAVGRDDPDSDAEVPTSAPITTTSPVRPTRQWFNGKHFWLLVITTIVCGSVVVFVLMARQGRQLYIRKIAGLEAIEEAVGRATETGRGCLFIPGLQDINEIQTIAGLSLLSRVSKLVAEYDAEISVPTSRSLVMTAARETVASAFLEAGRPDAYQEDAIYYVTDEQFGYVAHLTGLLVREKPAACFYFGSFFAESLILAETGNSVGAIQVAGTAQPAQLPFFVAACDYTLIGEEFFAASAYLSGDPDQLGSLKGQDFGKVLVGVLILIGVGLLTLANIPGLEEIAGDAAEYLKEKILSSG
jgi:hypothetical protein